MKKTKIFTTVIGLCLIASLFAGCNSGTQETAQASLIAGGQTQITVDNGAGNTDAAADNEYAFSYNGYKIIPGTEAETAIAALGSNYEYFEGASCAGQGVDIAYMYPGFTLGVYKVNGVELITVIEVDDSLIDCNGIHVGDSLADAKAKYGTPDQEDDFGVIYKGGKTQLQIITDGADGIVSIVYRTAE